MDVNGYICIILYRLSGESDTVPIYIKKDQRITTIFQRRKLGWKEPSKLVRLKPKHNQEAQLSGKTRDNNMGTKKNMQKTPYLHHISCLPTKMLQKQQPFTIFLHQKAIHLLLQPSPPYFTGPCLKPLPNHIARWPCNHLLSNWKIPNSWIFHLRPTSLKNLGAKTQQKNPAVPKCPNGFMIRVFFGGLEHELRF